VKDVKKEIKEQMKDTPDLCTRYYMLEDWYTALAYDAEAKNPKDDKFTDLDDKTESDVPFRAGRTYTVYDSYRLSQNHAKKASKYANKMIKQTLNQLVKQVYGPLRVFEKLSPKKARKKPNTLKKLCNLPPSPPPPPPSAPTWKNLVCPEGETKYNFEQLMYDVSLGAMSCTDVIKGAKPASLGNVEGAMEAGNEDSTSYCFLADGVTPSTISIGSSSVKLAIKDICPKACGVCAAVPTKDTSDADMRAVTGSTCAALAETCATYQQTAFMCPETCGPIDACDHHAYVAAQQDCIANAASYGQTIGECEGTIRFWTKDADGICGAGTYYYEGDMSNCWPAMTEKECPPPTPLTCEEKQSCLSPSPPPLAPAWSGVCSEISTKEDCDEAAGSFSTIFSAAETPEMKSQACQWNAEIRACVPAHKATGFVKYPGYAGKITVPSDLEVVVTTVDTTQHMSIRITGGAAGDRDITKMGLCTGLPKPGVANSCGIHIHEGFTCSDPDQASRRPPAGCRRPPAPRPMLRSPLSSTSPLLPQLPLHAARPPALYRRPALASAVRHLTLPAAPTSSDRRALLQGFVS